MKIESFIRNIPDFPKKGINFKDITPLLSSAEAFSYSISMMYEKLREKKINKIAGIEARGFIFGAALAEKMNVGFVPIRKPGKLPFKTIQESYELEYGTDTLEVHQDAFNDKDRIVLVDDLLATGGTALAAKKLIERTDAKLEAMVFLIELRFLNGRKKIDNEDIISLLEYD